jgi:hypothetical protein
MTKKKPLAPLKFSTRAKDLPASQGMLHLVRSELKTDIRGCVPK